MHEIYPLKHFRFNTKFPFQFQNVIHVIREVKFFFYYEAKAPKIDLIELVPKSVYFHI